MALLGQVYLAMLLAITKYLEDDWNLLRDFLRTNQYNEMADLPSKVETTSIDRGCCVRITSSLWACGNPGCCTGVQ